MRFEGLPGEFSQHDFGHVDVRFVDGRKKRVHFFASRLKYSRFVAVSLVDNEQTETIVRCLARHFVCFGGLPLLAVFDRPRTIVKKSGKGRDVEPTLAGRHVEALFALLERHGDEAMRDAIRRAVKSGRLTVAGVERALTPARGRRTGQLALPIVRAQLKGGAS